MIKLKEKKKLMDHNKKDLNFFADCVNQSLILAEKKLNISLYFKFNYETLIILN
jgi:hypothetical protein